MYPPQPTCSLFRHAMSAAVGYMSLIGHEADCLLRKRYRRPFRRLAVDLVILPGIGLLQSVNWVCLAVDELLFPGLRKVEIHRPVFIVGPPRSGTTHLHRALAGDRKRFSTAGTWEVFLAPSILQKKLFRLLRTADRKIGRPLARLWSFLESRLLGGFDETHPSALDEPEEDYFYLSTLHACTGWILIFPHWPALWNLVPGVGDDITARRRALDFYKRCLRRQLYADGSDRLLLSKNASFSSWLDVLPDVFPDARFVVCMRPASETIPSMLSTADKAMVDFASFPRNPASVHGRLIDAMKAHYREVNRAVNALPGERITVVGIDELKNALPRVLDRLATFLEIGFSEEFADGIAERGQRSRRHRSRHRYSADEYHLDPSELDRQCPQPVVSPARTGV
ncbi:MAG: sulfotransferase [Kiritimatiellia bacterium]